MGAKRPTIILPVSLLITYHFNVTYFLYYQVARSIRQIKQQITRLIISN